MKKPIFKMGFFCL